MRSQAIALCRSVTRGQAERDGPVQDQELERTDERLEGRNAEPCVQAGGIEDSKDQPEAAEREEHPVKYVPPELGPAGRDQDELEADTLPIGPRERFTFGMGNAPFEPGCDRYEDHKQVGAEGRSCRDDGHDDETEEQSHAVEGLSTNRSPSIWRRKRR